MACMLAEVSRKVEFFTKRSCCGTKPPKMSACRNFIWLKHCVETPCPALIARWWHSPGLIPRRTVRVPTSKKLSDYQVRADGQAGHSQVAGDIWQSHRGWTVKILDVGRALRHQLMSHAVPFFLQTSFYRSGIIWWQSFVCTILISSWSCRILFIQLETAMNLGFTDFYSIWHQTPTRKALCSPKYSKLVMNTDLECLDWWNMRLMLFLGKNTSLLYFVVLIIFNSFGGHFQSIVFYLQNKVIGKKIIQKHLFQNNHWLTMSEKSLRSVFEVYPAILWGWKKKTTSQSVFFIILHLWRFLH